MSIEEFEEGNKYKLIDEKSFKERNGNCYDEVFDEFGCVIFDSVDGDGNGWVGHSCVAIFRSEGDWFELVEEGITPSTQIIPDNNVDAIETHPEPVEEQSHPIVPSVGENVPEAVTSCPIEQIKQLCSDHDVNIEISNKGEIYIHIENIDNTYKVSDMKQLTQVLDSVKLLESFKEG